MLGHVDTGHEFQGAAENIELIAAMTNSALLKLHRGGLSADYGYNHHHMNH